MEEKVIINDYQSLEKRFARNMFESNIPPREMIDLFKEYLPIHIMVATVWGKNEGQKLEETKRLKNACDEFRKKIKEFNFFGSIIFIINGEPVVARIYFDEERDEKEIDVSYSFIIDYQVEFK